MFDSTSYMQSHLNSVLDMLLFSGYKIIMFIAKLVAK